LRLGDPAVLPRVHDGACLLDLRCIPEADDDRLLAAVGAALAGLDP
jgi:L-seryl-tRNA(Ser) seleniumtransferase